MRHICSWLRPRHFLALLLACAVLAALQPALALDSSPRRLALVIGNDAYKNVDPLTNARNDARLFASVLKRAGFSVTTVLDVGRDGFWAAVDTFKGRINKGDEVVFYYAGHGVQIASNQLLLPVDIKAQNDGQVQRDGVSLVDVQDALKDARFAMFVIDACRDNPFPKQGTRSIGTTRGLLPPEPATGQVIIMSAGRNQKALDSVPGVKADNGLFTYELAQVLQQPGVEIRTALETVKETVDDVAKKVNHEQRPSLVNDLRGNFYFFAPAALQASPAGEASAPYAAPAKTAEQIEDDTWDSVKDSTDLASLNEYLRQYPKGRHVGQARVAIARVKAGAKHTGSAAELAQRQEEQLWQSAKNGDRKELVAYLERYPSGSFAVDAKQLLMRLNQEESAWEAAAKADTIEAYKVYDLHYPTGQFASASRQRQDQLNANALALRRLNDAAQIGDSTALKQLGLAYLDGELVAKDEAKAALWLRKALLAKSPGVEADVQQRARAGDASAMGLMGSMYLNGQGGLAKSPADALRWFTDAAKAGSPLGLNGLGFMYLNGLGGLGKDEIRGAELIRRAADAGNGMAMVNLANLYAAGRAGIAKNEEQALQLFRNGADAGESGAMLRLGFLYEIGRGGLAKDDAQAVLMYRRAAEQGNGTAMGNLGVMYANGRGGLPRDDVQAVAWYRKGADMGDGQAMTNLGAAYAAGRGGLGKDEVQALSWHRKSAELGNGLGMSNLGQMYANGRGGLDKDDVQAVAWYRKGAELGVNQAMLNLGYMYSNGRGGLDKDDVQAANWYRKAADQGSALGMTNLGYMYQTGRGGVPKDALQAVSWYRKGADLGDSQAMNNLGACYAAGIGGLEKSKDLARHWYQRAADLGNERAKENLKKL